MRKQKTVRLSMIVKDVSCFEARDASVDLRLRARGHSQKGIAPGSQFLQNATDQQRTLFEKTPILQTLSCSRRANHLGRSLQTTDSVQLTLGQH